MAEHCRNWKGDERCGAPAEFIVWGKLFPAEALGPRCYDCAADQVGHHGLTPGNPQGYAIYHLNDVDNAMAQRDYLLSALKQACDRIWKAERNEEWGDDFESEVSLARADLIAMLEQVEGGEHG